MMDPLVFEPYLRPMIWGGRRLGERFGKRLPAGGPFGESWEVSAHPHHVSRVSEGPLRGLLLTDLVATRGEELFGDQVPSGGEFPLLIKLLDCRDRLSIQVHPSDELAPRLSNEARGKTEAWLVLEVDLGGWVCAGLRPGVGRADLERHLQAGTVEECLHRYTPRVGDCLFLPAGTVHAAGGGVVLAEVQQSSDATFRLFDWNRPGSNGKPRPLHLSEALQSINWAAGPVHPATGDPVAGLPGGVTGEALVRCRYFCMDRFHAGGPFDSPYPPRLSLWMVLNGTAECCCAGYRRTLRRGETVLVPASCAGLSWHPGAPAGRATLLGVTLPRDG
jgi:mannose-6-phosphate isomerase